MNDERTIIEENEMLEAQCRLAEIMNNTPHIVNLEGTRFAITRLKYGTQYLICEEAIKVAKGENMAFGDIMKQLATNTPSIFKIITLAVLNNKERIFKNGDELHGFSEEFEATYNTLMWDVTNDEGIVTMLMEILKMIDVGFFLTTSEAVKTMRQMMTKTIQLQKS
ncbi:MAG: hypothetical protein II604_09245 [Bacteroidales bacterium]|nr:hypothetical protein [Bacteroidales bacterium]